ncbi:MAG: TetR/AcrR family transcriptional regulator [Thermodesulfobacteriota bacterium]
MAVKKRISGEERKERIVDAAENLFAKKGFKGTTTKEVAKAAGISEAVIFRHFADKSGLYAAIINRCCSDKHGNLKLETRLKGKSGKDAFIAIADYFMEVYAEDTTFARLLLFSALEKHKFSDMFIESRGLGTLDLISGLIKDGIKKRELRKIDPELAARAFLGMVLHYCMTQEIFGFKRFFSRPRKKAAEAFAGIFFNGISKEKASGSSIFQREVRRD